jgi:hypothetical protein
MAIGDRALGFRASSPGDLECEEQERGEKGAPGSGLSSLTKKNAGSTEFRVFNIETSEESISDLKFSSFQSDQTLST